MSRVMRVGYQIYTSITFAVFFQSCFIIYQCDDDFSIFWCIGSTNKDEIVILDSLLIHRVSFSSEEEVLIGRREKFRRYRDLGLDILLSEYGHTTGDSTDKRDATYLVTIGRILRRYFDILESISIEPSFLHDLIEEDRYRSRRGISESTLESSDRDFLSFAEIFSDLLKNELFFGGELFHKSKEIKIITYNVYKRVYMYTF
jgi:hypothetical protein